MPTSAPHPLARPIALAALLLPLAGCVSFGPKPPPSLLTLSAAAPVSAGPARTTSDAQAIAVNIPNVPPQLVTPRVLVQAGANQVAYLPKGRWAAAPALLFRNLLAETITARTGRFVPDQRATGSQPDTRLSGQLTQFELDGPGNAVVVTFDGVINRASSSGYQTRRFTARVPVSAQTPDAVAAGINQAANQVAGEVAAWIGG